MKINTASQFLILLGNVKNEIPLPNPHVNFHLNKAITPCRHYMMTSYVPNDVILGKSTRNQQFQNDLLSFEMHICLFKHM